MAKEDAASIIVHNILEVQAKMRELRRVLLVRPEEEQRFKDEVARLGIEAVVEVQASEFVPKGTMYFVANPGVFPQDTSGTEPESKESEDGDQG